MYGLVLGYGPDRVMFWYDLEADGIIFLTIREAGGEDRIKIFAGKLLF